LRFGCKNKQSSSQIAWRNVRDEMRRRKSRTRRLHRYFQISQDDDHPMKTNVHVSVNTDKIHGECEQSQTYSKFTHSQIHMSVNTAPMSGVFTLNMLM
jgi:hypothetical protein